METGCSGLHVLLRAPESSCKGAVDDYNAADIVVHCDLMQYIAKLRLLTRVLTLKHLQNLRPALIFIQRGTVSIPSKCFLQVLIIIDNRLSIISIMFISQRE